MDKMEKVTDVDMGGKLATEAVYKVARRKRYDQHLEGISRCFNQGDKRGAQEHALRLLVHLDYELDGRLEVRK